MIWVALKVGALSFGGGFVIVPLMQHDAVSSYHWMTSTRFLSAVALGQVTPGPVVASIAAVGYAARGAGGALLASLVAFAPSFAFVLLGGGRFERLRTNDSARHSCAARGPSRSARFSAPRCRWRARSRRAGRFPCSWPPRWRS